MPTPAKGKNTSAGNNLTSRRGTNNLYYKRLVPLELRAAGRPGQVWRSLGTSDWKKAEAAYGATHAEIEALFAQWRQDDAQPVRSVQSQLPLKGSPNFVPLTPALETAGAAPACR